MCSCKEIDAIGPEKSHDLPGNQNLAQHMENAHLFFKSFNAVWKKQNRQRIQIDSDEVRMAGGMSIKYS